MVVVDVIVIIQVSAQKQLAQFIDAHPLALAIDYFTIPDQTYVISEGMRGMIMLLSW